MIEYLQFKNIKGEFENLKINIHTVSIERFAAIKNSELPEHTALTNVWEDLNFYYPNESDLNEVGKIFLCMRNQRETENTILFISFALNAMAKNEMDKANVFTKTLQYLFDWLNSKTENDEIQDRKGGKFITPVFAYSRSHFERHF